MATFDLKLTGIETLKPLIAFCEPKLLAKAVQGGIRYAAKAGATQAAKSVTARYNIKSSRVKQDIKGPWITQGQATIAFSRRPPTLNQYGLTPGRRGGPQPGLGHAMGWGKPSPKGKPSTARIFKGEARQTYRGAFLVKGIPMRFIKAKSKFEVLYGPSVGAEIFGKGRYAPVIKAEVQQRIQEQFITGMQRVLDSAARGYGKP